VSDQRVGASFRAVRVRRGDRQQEVTARAGVSRSVVSRIERGRLTEVSLDSLRRVGAALDMRVDVVVRWRGGELDRLVNARHSALHEAAAQMFTKHPEWIVAPEVSFSIYGERGVVDIMAWHASSRNLLVIELKSELVDIQELIGSIDRKRRLAPRIAFERGWDSVAVSTWVVVGESRTNRRHVARHGALLRTAFPSNGHGLRSWLRTPDGPVSGLSFLTYGQHANLRRGLATPHRVRRPSSHR
jgi:transcriptional regulator with XRE-family HTH domain